jgi:IclR family acetate operon transcriptional repressor
VPASIDAPSPEHRSGTQTVERALAILNLFRDGPDSLSITEIARQTGLHVSTAHRIVRALCAEQFMDQDIRSERYLLGPSLAILGRRALDSSGLGVAQPILEHLAESTGESVSLGVRRGAELVVVLSASSHQRLRFDHEPGSVIQLHASAMGKVLLAFSDVAPKAAVAALPDLVRYTDSTITGRAALTADLEEAHRKGYAVNHEERYDGVCGVAAPVLDRRELAVAAVGLQGPTIRLTAKRLVQVAVEVRAAAHDVAAAMRAR